YEYTSSPPGSRWSRGLTPPAASAIATHALKSGSEGAPTSPPKPPSAFWTSCRKRTVRSSRATFAASGLAARPGAATSSATPSASSSAPASAALRASATAGAGPTARLADERHAIDVHRSRQHPQRDRPAPCRRRREQLPRLRRAAGGDRDDARSAAGAQLHARA